MIRYLSILLLGMSAAAALAQPADPDERARATESRMTDAERIQLLHGIMALPIPGMPPVPDGVKFSAGYIAGIPRLGVPDLRETDAGLGVANPLGMRAGDVATAMPSGQALAAAFDPELAFQGGETIGREARAKGFNVLLGGGVNLARDYRNGRNFEYLGEDPLLAGTLAGEEIRGTQSTHVISTIKHFALNGQETSRHTGDARIEEAALRESDLLAFELAIARGQPGSVMCAYNHVNGPAACGNHHLLTDVLKQDWFYRGWVMSDWGAVGGTDFITAGLDQQSGEQIDGKPWFGALLADELKAGHVPRERVSDAVRRILRSVYAIGADQPAAAETLDYEADAKVAQRVAEEGAVLLKNDGILPIAPSVKSILVVGGHADRGVLSGGGSSQVIPVGGPALMTPVGGPGPFGMFMRQVYLPSSPLAALKAALPGVKVEFDSGYAPSAAAATAKHYDLVVLFATQWQSEGVDGDGLALPEGQDALISAVVQANPRTVVVLETGNPVGMPWLGKVGGVLEAWYPGQKGGEAIADLLTGKVNPSGRLPQSFPATEGQAPRPVLPGLGESDEKPVAIPYDEGAAVGYRWFAAQKQKPLFPFGHGLSYTSFTHGALAIDPAGKARVSVTNKGARAGADTLQLYLVDAAGQKTQRLVAFRRVTLEPGETRDIELSAEPKLLADWGSQGWMRKTGRYGFALGDTAAQLGPVVTVELGADQPK